MSSSSSQAGVRILGCACLTLLGCLSVAPADPRWREARVVVPVASVYASPADQAERVTQALLGERVLVRQLRGPWAQVMLPDQYRTPQGYPGWMLQRHLVLGAPARSDPVVTVRVSRARLHREPRRTSPTLMLARLSSDLPWIGFQDSWYQVRLPGSAPGGVAWVHAEDVVDGCLPPVASDLLRTAAQLKGTPYLWGGMSSLGIDCSGLVFTTFKVHGRLLPRDADQQFQVGTPVAMPDLLPGDLVFFGSGDQDVRHVGIYVGEGRFLDASGRRGVAESRLDEAQLSKTWLGGRRILP